MFTRTPASRHTRRERRELKVNEIKVNRFFFFCHLLLLAKQAELLQPTGKNLENESTTEELLGLTEVSSHLNYIIFSSETLAVCRLVNTADCVKRAEQTEQGKVDY